jgi:putative transposase
MDIPDHVWAIDFLQDRTHDGRPVRILTITDEHTREALAASVARRMGAHQTLAGSSPPEDRILSLE